jgi:TonB family protein
MSMRTVRMLLFAIAAVATAAGWITLGSFPLLGQARVLTPAIPLDQAGITVNEGGSLLSRPPIIYPAEVRQERIEGPIFVELTLNPNGDVVDAHVISGPEEFRRTVLQSVLLWHYAPEGSSTRTVVVTVDFRLPPVAPDVNPVVHLPDSPAPDRQPRRLPTCTGNSDCVTGTYLCTLSNPNLVNGSVTLLDTDTIYSDGLGPYVNATYNVQKVEAGGGAELWFNSSIKGNKVVRSVHFNLNNPVPGDIGVPLGIVTDDQNFAVAAKWYVDSNYVKHSLLDIPVGQTVYSDTISPAFHLNGRYYTFQAGPARTGICYSNSTTTIYGDGTTQGTIYRATATKWVVDLPPGSIARLFDVTNTYQYAVNKGLYYISLHYTIGQ